LITGAAGFLGSHLCDRFIKEGYHVIGMDNLITGDMRILNTCSNWRILNSIIMMFPNYSYRGELDYILHFASPASPIDYLKIPIQTLKVGALGTHNCLGLAKAKMQGSWLLLPVKCMAIRWCIRKQKNIGAM
jgi:dTDP-glucose 4,6-dehydratase